MARETNRTASRSAVDPDVRTDETAGVDSDRALCARALEACEHAYSPYSKLRVGAALLAADGRVFTGCNVESASYGLTLCAERTALVKAISEGARAFTVLAVASDRAHAIPPCGACRQFLHEFAPSLRILLVAPGVDRQELSLSALLPHAFDATDLR